jgi:hypothetical protein
MSDGNQYLIEKLDKLVDAVSENTVWVGRYMEKHDGLSDRQDKSEERQDKTEATVQAQAVTIALHNETHADVKKVKNSLIVGVVSIIVGLTSALVYVVVMSNTPDNAIITHTTNKASK